MFYGWFLLLTLNYFATEAQTLPSNSMQDVMKIDLSMKPKVKRTQELLMFGNQQNSQTENNAASSFSSSSEKRMLSSSGLEDSKDDHQIFPQQDQKYYDYGKVLVNELGDVLNVPPYPYYNSEDRRKRSDETVTHFSTASSTPPSSLPVTYSTQPPVSQAQNKRSLYQEPRYKRESDVDPEAMLELLQAWENEHRNRNWRNLANNEYENIETDSNLIGAEDEPRRGVTWLERPMYPPPRHYSIGVDSIGIPRTYGNQYGQQYNMEPQYVSARYGAIYPQHVYYPQEKRFVVSRKRSQGYEVYGGRTMAQLLAASRGYPKYYRFMY